MESIKKKISNRYSVRISLAVKETQYLHIILDFEILFHQVR